MSVFYLYVSLLLLKHNTTMEVMTTVPPAPITDYQGILEFLFAGRAVFSLLDTRSKERITFYVSKAEDKDMWFCYVKFGDMRKYFGYMVPSGNDVRLLPAKTPKIGWEDIRVKYFRAFMKRMAERAVPEFINFWHEGVCAKCGRALTVPESISTGFGPVCKRRMADETVPMRKK